MITIVRNMRIRRKLVNTTTKKKEEEEEEEEQKGIMAINHRSKEFMLVSDK